MLRRWIHFAAVVFIVVPLALVASGNSGQRSAAPEVPTAEVKKIPAPYTSPSSGKDMYIAYRAACHGKDGTGDGPAAPALKSAPTDLTLLAAKNGGKFPESHVVQTIKGDSATPSHGSKDMPVWGPIFRAMGTTSDSVVQLRVRNLTKYIASIQQR